MSNDTTILIIDDDPDIIEVAKLVMEDEGYRVITDNKGIYFDDPGAELPNLVLLDLLIEGNNGEKIAEKIKSTPRTSRVPVIIVSAHTPTEVRAVVQKTQADGFITKPFDIDRLIEVVQQHL
jgi:DNA-binding response OmpR family regulator